MFHVCASVLPRPQPINCACLDAVDVAAAVGVVTAVQGNGLQQPYIGTSCARRLPQKLVRGHSNWFCARQISPDIGNLTGIEQIGLQGNMLTSMPDEFGQLVRLKRLCARRLSLH
jgi:hypothetical protein